MSDIVERLRDYDIGNMEAADEVERLLAENKKLHREAAIRIDQIEREQEAHLRTIADYNRVAVENEKLRELVKAAYYEAYRDRDSLGDAGTDDPEDRCAWRLSAAAAAIRESGDE